MEQRPEHRRYTTRAGNKAIEDLQHSSSRPSALLDENIFATECLSFLPSKLTDNVPQQHTDTGSCTLLPLPGEIQNKIMGELEPIDLLVLRATCRHLRNIIPRLDIHALLTAESSDTGIARDLYACRLCLRLRHSSHFADTMKKKDKRKLAGGGVTRFCMDCGLKPAPGQNGYGRGTYITINSAVSVICICCTRLEPPSHDRYGKNTQYCTRCWARTPEAREMRRLKEAELQRELEGRERRRRERKAMWGSDAEDTDEDTDEEGSAGIYNADDDCGDWRDYLL